MKSCYNMYIIHRNKIERGIGQRIYIVILDRYTGRIGRY